MYVVEQLPALDRAKLDLVGTYAINSLFWSKQCLVLDYEILLKMYDNM